MNQSQAAKFAATTERARTARGLSIRKAAEIGGISDTTWRRIEDPEALLRYDPRPSTLRAIARALDVRHDQVFHWAGKSFAGIEEPLTLEEALAAGDRQPAPAALARLWAQLTSDEQQRLLGYAESLLAQRDH